jgi:hypothetical protein
MCSLFCRGKIIFDIRKTVIVNFVFVFLWKWMVLPEESHLNLSTTPFNIVYCGKFVFPFYFFCLLEVTAEDISAFISTSSLTWYNSSFHNHLMSQATVYLLGGKARPALKADNLTAICRPIV